MKDELFRTLEASVHEGGAILRGEQSPSRSFVIENSDVKGLCIIPAFADGLCRDARHQCQDTSQLGARTSEARGTGTSVAPNRGEAPGGCLGRGSPWDTSR